ncbi:MAG: NADP-dependent oxidoreductase [Alphaproteobacteria bacterium]|nr:NADP-dependent oxidoreductase [Alphaproteobacteria bacterium]
MDQINRQVLLKRRPSGLPVRADFEIVDAPIPDPGDGQVLLRGLYLSLDPYMRGRISGVRSYARPVEIGEVIEGRVVGCVARSRHPDFREGDYAFGGYGWQLYSVIDGHALTRLDAAEAPISTALGVLGMPGLTAYVGLSDIGQPKAGETVVVSAASGAVGAVAGQLAMAKGARVVGIVGGAEKCRYVEQELGFDAAIDHRTPDLGAALDAACPNGIDVYFENVGGAVQQAVFPRLNDFGRMVMCGMISEYNDREPRPGPNLGAVVRKRLRIQGFIVGDQRQRIAEYRAMAAPLLRDGRLKYREDIVEGLDHAPEAFIGLLQGKNFGKLLVKLGDDPSRRNGS